MSLVVPKQPEFQRSAFDELLVTEKSPEAQITAQYGLLDDTFSTALGGTVGVVDSKFKITSGVSGTGVATISTDKQVSYRAGQGLTALLSSVFTQGVANNTQIAGLLTSDSTFAFGFNGTEFGIGYGRGGALEIQELLITTPASGSENATVTVDNIPHTVPITSGTDVKNAWEIASYLKANDPRYNFSSNNGIVYCQAKLPELGGGTWAFSSPTAVASFIQKQDGAIQTEVWVKKEDWNVNPNINIDPTKGNLYQIQMTYTGFGDTFFSVANPETGKLEVVHILKYTNTATVPVVDNPIFRAGWGVRNKGNTTDITVEGAAAAIFIEGEVKLDAPPRGQCTVQSGVSTLALNILSLRNRLTFGFNTNRSNIVPSFLELGTDTDKLAIFEIYEDPVYTNFVDWQFVDTTKSLMEINETSTTITSGRLVACYFATKQSPTHVDIGELISFMKPDKTYSIAAKVSVNPASNVYVTASWKEDL